VTEHVSRTHSLRCTCTSPAKPYRCAFFDHRMFAAALNRSLETRSQTRKLNP